ncbi:MAG: hypothetical protein GKR98_05200 [Boseongicola sp.]|nr:MAG: hypothetical protein GKR98_05200 [Boseongicola sp.]
MQQMMQMFRFMTPFIGPVAQFAKTLNRMDGIGVTQKQVNFVAAQKP